MSSRYFYITYIALILVACSDTNANNQFNNLSELPDQALTEEQQNLITHDCTELGSTDNPNGCALFSMQDSDYDQSILVDIAGFSEQDLIDQIAVFFPNASEAPVIIIETDGTLEDGFSNPYGFNVVLR